MFKNYNELIQMLEDGQDIITIRDERLAYLESEEYKRTLSPRINSQNDEVVLLLNGFITKDEVMRIQRFKK